MTVAEVSEAVHKGKWVVATKCVSLLLVSATHPDSQKAR